MEVLRSLRYSLYIIFHPFDGFWDLKHEKRGNLKAAFILVFALGLTYVLQVQYKGFIFNLNDPSRLNIFIQFVGVIIPFALWCVANWCLTTLMDGEGSFKDIVITTAFALTPMIIINFFNIIFSNLITVEEAAFLNFFQSLALLWSGALIIFGTMVVHQYTLPKTILTSVLIVIGMGLILFIALLFFSLIQQIYTFIYIIFKEISLRL